MPPSRSRRSRIGDGLVRELGLHLASRADTGQAGADDQGVEVLCHGIEDGRARSTSEVLTKPDTFFIISRHRE